MNLKINGTRERGNSKKKWMDCLKDDVIVKELTVNITRDRKGRRTRIRSRVSLR
jgi:hypothetical protein